MVALPELGDYNPEQLRRARELSPAFQRYQELSTRLPESSLHRVRHEAWMKCVLATFFNTAEAAAVCAYWSASADGILRRAWHESGLESLNTVLFALGKHGAGELNLSSDIDVLVVAEGADLSGVERGLRVFRNLLHLAGDAGFCFRLDFDLRPGGKMGPLITTPSQFQDYYWSQGETWERLALVRLRAICGPVALEAQIMDLARRFSFRKFLDFTLLEDLKALRSQVHQKGFVRQEGELHLKLEVGGIRDIELFVHSLLVMNGGKIPELRTRSTTEALQRLQEKGLLPANEAEFLRDSYWYLRQLENTVQSFDDLQTHSLRDGMPGLPNRAEVLERMSRVDKQVSGLLGKVDLETVHLPADLEAQHAWLLGLGFTQPVFTRAWDDLIKATALSYKNDRDERARKEFLYTFVESLARNKALDRDLGLNLLVDFVRATRAKATFFTMLLRSPRLIDDLARLFCLSPYVGSIVAARPELLDHFILQVDDAWAADLEGLLAQMGERKLLTELWSANRFLTDRNLGAMFEHITATADSIGAQLLTHLKSEYPGSQLEIVTLGKWAGREMGLRSDLDFIFVSPVPPTEADFKVARRFISRFTDPSRGGSLYDLDLRLRPSGQSGPLLVAIDKLYEYWRGFAQGWERQAYLRARPLSPAIKLDKSLLVEKKLSDADLAELKGIRTKLLRKSRDGIVDVKYSPGGLLDIEFVAQTAILNLGRQTGACSTSGMIDSLPEWSLAGAELKQIYARLREFEQMVQLSATHKIGEVPIDSPVFTKAAALMNLSAGEARGEIRALCEKSRGLLNNLDPTGLKI